MIKRMKRAFFLVVGSLLLAKTVHAAAYDLRIAPGDVMLVPADVIARQTVRIYATVENIGERDAEGTIEFYDGSRKIGSKALSVRAGGRPDEVWIPWTPESEGGHLLRIRLVSDPDTPDENLGNGQVELEVYSDRDTDGDGFGDRRDQDDDNDGTPDTSDQFPLDPRRQKDTDNDGVEDAQDTDDDNDGLSDEDEARLGTNPLKRDTDGDGVGDKEDAFPLDATRSVKEVPKPTPPPAPSPAATKTAPNPTPARSSAAVASGATTTRVLLSATTTPLDLNIQPVTTGVLEQLGATTASLPFANPESADSGKREAEVVVTEAAQEEHSSPTLPLLIVLAVVSGAAGGWFLFKSRAV